MTPSATGSIIFLHGASSSGKTTIARALQAAIDAPFLHLSIDHLRDSGVLPTAGIASGEFPWVEMRARFFAGYHRSLAAFAGAGNDLIVEHILDTPRWHGELARLLGPFDLFFVGIHCSLPELRRREVARGDRPSGMAERDHRNVHHGLRYDFELDAEDTIERNVAMLLSAWRARRAPSAFLDLS